MKSPEDILNRFAALFGVAKARGLPLQHLTLDDLETLEAAITRKPKYLVTRSVLGEDEYLSCISEGRPVTTSEREDATEFATLAAAEVIACLCGGTVQEITGR